MKKLLVALVVAVVATAFCFEASAQRPGFTRYTLTKNISNGQATPASGGAAYWVKFDGDLLWIDGGFGVDMRYQFNGTQNNGNKLYYFTAYNNGTITQGSGWMTFYDSWALVSPDRRTINVMRDNGNNGQVLKIMNASAAGDLIE